MTLATVPVISPSRRGWRRIAPLVVLPTLTGWAAYVLVYDPTDTSSDLTGPCTWHALFGVDGPTCGITRMSWYLLHGDLIHAAQSHLLALVGLPLLAYAYLRWVARSTFGQRLPWPSRRITKTLVIGYIALFLLYAVVLRNLPWVPFTWFYVSDLTSAGI